MAAAPADSVISAQLSIDAPLQATLTDGTADSDYPLCLKLYQYDRVIPLSESVPMLENMGLKIDTEHPTSITLPDGHPAWVSQLDVAPEREGIRDIATTGRLFQETLHAIRMGQCENDGLNRLVLFAGLSFQEVTILRAYTRYLQQVHFRFTRPYIQKTLALHPDIATLLVQFFKLRFAKAATPGSQKALTDLEKEFQSKLDAVTSLDEDRILRRFWQLIEATLRTTYFQKTSDGTPKPWLAVKLDSRAIPEMPLPTPLYEIWVYSPHFEGIHLRNTKIARGGIRWSDRPEDFRTEILGLMKAQRVKNAVIVPSGAKGGFVVRQPSPSKQDVIACYQSFIRGLLDLTDNIAGDKIIPPPSVVCHDDADPYLVVAADKGTASFSDIANAISAEYHFWLGDAFASGGSMGYDHKKIGITARGAWESAKRHLRELGRHLDDDEGVTIAGIGDMSGDVFGNGMIYSKNIRLVAAFDHRDIFLDPTPDPEKSYEERQRLFNLPTSSWQDFDKSLISAGGGIFSRAAKSIPLSPAVQKMLDTKETALAPTDLIRAILKAPLDMLFNGGIGTYVKSSMESHADAGDRTNDLCRINGAELRCKIVCEGGNLGFTQRGRIEYALQGGLINTDFIDNSAGVDCSDHEVNLKILLNAEMAASKLTLLQRNQLLVTMTESVAALVLADNYNQALAMSFSAQHAAHYLSLYQAVLQDLEKYADLDRAVEFLPDDKTFQERKTLNIGLTRPELAVMLSYTKIHIKNEILNSNLPDDPWFLNTLNAAFPPEISEKYTAALSKHRLRREIIATELSNQTVNAMGITFVWRLQTETGLPVSDVVRAYIIASHVFVTQKIHKEIDELDVRVPAKMQYELLHHVRQLINLATRWFLRENRLRGDISKIISHFKSSIDQLVKNLPRYISGMTKDYLENLAQEFIHMGLPSDLGHRVALARSMYTTLNVTEVATRHHFDLERTAAAYFDVGGRFGLVWFRDQIASDNREGTWNNRARIALRDELDSSQRRLCVAVMKQDQKSGTPDQIITNWIKTNESIYNRWASLLETVQGSASLDYILFFVALRELSSLIAESGA